MRAFPRTATKRTLLKWLGEDFGDSATRIGVALGLTARDASALKTGARNTNIDKLGSYYGYVKSPCMDGMWVRKDSSCKSLQDAISNSQTPGAA